MPHRAKVIHLTEDLALGGQEKIIAALACGLDPQRYGVEVWCLVRGGILAEVLRQAGATVRILGLRSYHNPLNLLRLALRLRRAGADIVHTHGHFAGTFGRLSAILAGKRRLVAHVHTTEPALRPRHVRIQRYLAAFTRHIICVSHSVRDFVTSELGIPPEKSCVVYNGVPHPSQSASDVRQDPIPGPGECLIVSVGSLVENKGHRLLIDAFKRAATQRPGLRLLIVGDGPLRPQLQNQIHKLALQAHVRLAGRRLDVHPILRQAGMFVLPTLHREGLSLALLEAAQHGLPVIASRVGGVPEVIEHNRSGLLVPPGDPEALCDAIVKLADDAHLRRRLGEAGRARYRARFRTDRMVARIESLYASMCMGGRSRPGRRGVLLFSSFAQRGRGGQESLFQLACTLPPQRFRPCVLAPSEGTLSRSLRAAGIEVRVLDLPRIAIGNARRIAAALLRLARLIAELEIDILHTDGPRNTLYAGIVGRLKRKPVVWHIRSSARDPFDPLLYRLASRIILVARALAFRFPKHRKVRTLHNGVDLNRFCPAVDSGPARNSRSPLIGMVGRIEPQKGLKDLLSAAAVLKQDALKFKVHVAGEITDRGYLRDCREFCNTAGIRDRVRFQGHVHPVEHFLKAVDIFVLPSVEDEAFPRAVLEAMACGKPVVVTETGGAKEAVEDGHSGFVVAARSAAALADRLRVLLADEDLRARMGRRGRRRAEALFDIAGNTAGTCRVYEEVLECR